MICGEPDLPQEEGPEEFRLGLTLEVAAALRHVDGLAELDDRPPDEILGYDEHGLPR